MRSKILKKGVKFKNKNLPSNPAQEINRFICVSYEHSAFYHGK